MTEFDPHAALAELKRHTEAFKKLITDHRAYRHQLVDMIAGTERVLARTSADFRDQTVPTVQAMKNVRDMRAFRADLLRELAEHDAKEAQIHVISEALMAEAAAIKAAVIYQF